jgi:hypothetical protein
VSVEASKRADSDWRMSKITSPEREGLALRDFRRLPSVKEKAGKVCTKRHQSIGSPVLQKALEMLMLIQ